MNWKRTLLGFAISILILSASVQATTYPTTPLYLSGGNYPGGPTYTVWNEGSYYFVKDVYGHLLYDGNTNASLVINSVIAKYAEIFLEPGDYSIDSTIMLTVASVHLYGAGGNSTRLTLTAAVNMTFVAADYVEISDLWMDGELYNASGIFVQGYPSGSYSGALNCRFYNNRIQHFLGYGIFVNGEPANSWITNNRIIECGGGILLEGCSDLWVLNNDIGATVSRPCIVGDGDGANTISNNFVYMAGYNWTTSLFDSAQPGIQLYGSHFDMLSGNRVQMCGGDGIEVYNAYVNSITGGNIGFNGQSNETYNGGIRIVGNSNGTLISNVYFFNTGVVPYNSQRYGVFEYSQTALGTPIYSQISNCQAINMTIAGFWYNVTSQYHSCYNETSWVT